MAAEQFSLSFLPLCYLAPFHPPSLTFFSHALHFSPTSQRDSARKRDRMLTATSSSSSLLFLSQLPSLPAHAHTPLPLTGCRPRDFHQLSEAVLPLSPPSLPPPSTLAASTLLPPAFSCSSPPGCGNQWLCSSLDSLL